MTEVNPLFTLPGQPDAAGISEFDQVERAARRRRLIIWVGVSVVLVFAIVLVCGVFGKSGPQNARVGSCMSLNSGDSVQVVDCSSSAAHLKVVGRLSISSRPFDSQLTQDCAPWPTTIGAYYDADHHFVLCLASLGR